MTGSFDFVVPPGEYQLRAYGSTLHPRILTVTVPADRTTFTVDPIDLKLSELTRLKGKPAPEFVNVAGWHGEPIKLSELKGKFVLVDFWGYWCGPCVGAMPVLIELHEKFSDKGLVIVGVHVDGEGEVDTADKLKEKLTHIVKDIWKGKELPFSNALVSGKEEGEGDQLLRVGTPSIYGILNYPTTILIDREGVIVGQFHAGDIDSATTKIEELLGIKPKQ
jgi:thiol-disulfide isomerase/thioredoxin